MKQAGREQLWQQQAEEKQGTRSQNGEAGQKTKKRTGGRGDGWERETESARERERLRHRSSIQCIREGLNTPSFF